MKKPYLAFLSFFLFGCTTLNLSGSVVPEMTEVFKPFPAGQVMVKSVGEQLIGYSLLLRISTVPGFIATIDFRPPAIAMGQNTPMVKAGSEWKAIAKTKDGGYLCQNMTEKMTPEIFGGTKAEWEICLVINKANEPIGVATCDVYAPFFTSWEGKHENLLQPKKIIEGKSRTWREAEIIYAGKIKDTIRLIYRETAQKDIEFTYDLSESNTVAIKDITFEIAEATNSFIKYKIMTSPDELKSKIEEREKKEKERLEI